MANIDYQQVATGKDPRDFDEFERIRGEINKMTHPLHPPVDCNGLGLLYLLRTALIYKAWFITRWLERV